MFTDEIQVYTAENSGRDKGDRYGIDIHADLPIPMQERILGKISSKSPKPTAQGRIADIAS